jgi:pimeloyl-ACP methyl ester carboxylesterase
MALVDDWERRGTRHRINGFDVFVVDEPARRDDAEPALVIHGFPTSSLDWHRAVDTMRERRRVVLLDLPGYGFSSKPDVAYSLFAQADVVDALAAELALGEVALVTHDMGDSVGGELLARQLDGTLGFRVKRRVLTNGSIYIDMAALTDGQKLLLSLPDASLPPDAGIDASGLAAALRATFAPGSTVPDDDVQAMAACVVRDGGNRRLPRLIRYVEERRQHERRWTGAIEAHPAPLDVIWGDLDPIAVYPMVERLVAARPEARVHRLEGVGHYPMVEAPDRFGAALHRALEPE